MTAFISRFFGAKSKDPLQNLTTRLPPERFPCLYHGFEDDTVGGDQGSDGDFVAPEWSRDHIASSRQASDAELVLADGTRLVDYDLEPHRRRGGEEAVHLSRDPSGNFLTEAIFGSLPKGLSEVERATLKAQVGSTPVQSAFESYMVGTPIRSHEGSVIRRKALKGAVVVIVCAGYSGKRFTLERAHELGCRTVVIDGPDTWSKKCEEEGIIEKFIGVDMGDTDTLFDRLLDACHAVREELGALDCVTTFHELTVPITALLAERLGLPGNPPDACDKARDKHATRTVLEAAGLPTPKNFLITAEEQVAAAAKQVGFPAVIKPVSGAASMGVVRVDTEEELRSKYVSTVKALRSVKLVDNRLVESEEEGGGTAGVSTVILMEEYLDGPEVDVDLVLSDGVVVYGAVTDNWPTIEPYFNETGSNCPSTLKRKEQVELVDLAVRSVQALGFTCGVFHVEAKATSHGARLIEVNARMGGGPVRSTNLLVWGVDLVEQHLESMCGLPCLPEISPRPLIQMAEMSVNAKKTGTLQNTDFIKKYEDHPDVLYFRPIVQAGEKCVCVDDGMPTWLCEVMVAKPTIEEAIAFINEIEKYVDDNAAIV